MAKKNTEPTTRPRERAFLVGIEIFRQNDLLSLDESLAELDLLSETAGLDVVGQSTQKLKHPNSQTFIGPGKVEEVHALVEETRAEVVLFDEELSPRHLRELERVFGANVRILDRTALILDIFAQHADTREGALQVELAQYEYRLPRLTRAWTHLARQAGGGAARGGSGGVGLRGPGETQLEVDRREINRRVAQIKLDIEQVRRHRALHRRQRQKMAIPVVAIVGYTNAGKSTLLNALSGADVLVEDKLFATLDPTTRRVILPSGREILFSDTVGFIQKLPTQLVAAFRATLEEINEADLILHVVDITPPQANEQSETVMDTLADLGAMERPIIFALNKIDELEDDGALADWLDEFPNSSAISAAQGLGLDDLLEQVEEVLSAGLVYLTVQLPYDRGDLAALFHEHGTVVKTSHEGQGTTIEGYLPRRWLAQYRPYLA
ncbi:MAG TPA: GTPase HflX [Anaerolineae bacterium]|nr:GTPase HflX [Anaerolineae bacterium]